MALWTGDRISKLRRKLGFSQRQFALRIAVGLQTLRDWERDRTPAPGIAQALFDCLIWGHNAGHVLPPLRKKSPSRQAAPA
jgi:DNA-binding transcriptional regulator YiaG